MRSYVHLFNVEKMSVVVTDFNVDWKRKFPIKLDISTSECRENILCNTKKCSGLVCDTKYSHYYTDSSKDKEIFKKKIHYDYICEIQYVDTDLCINLTMEDLNDSRWVNILNSCQLVRLYSKGEETSTECSEIVDSSYVNKSYIIPMNHLFTLCYYQTKDSCMLSEGCMWCGGFFFFTMKVGTSYLYLVLLDFSDGCTDKVILKKGC